MRVIEARHHSSPRKSMTFVSAPFNDKTSVEVPTWAISPICDCNRFCLRLGRILSPNFPAAQYEINASSSHSHICTSFDNQSKIRN